MATPGGLKKFILRAAAGPFAGARARRATSKKIVSRGSARANEAAAGGARPLSRYRPHPTRPSHSGSPHRRASVHRAPPAGQCARENFTRDWPFSPSFSARPASLPGSMNNAGGVRAGGALRRRDGNEARSGTESKWPDRVADSENRSRQFDASRGCSSKIQGNLSVNGCAAGAIRR